MKLYFGGTEVGTHRTLLAAEGVEYVSLSYFGLRRRTKFSRPWVIAEKYPENQHIFLDSGAYTVNKAEDDQFTVAELKAIAAHYMSFVQDNIDRLDMVSEFDAQVLGPAWIEAAREDFWDELPEEKFLPVWHEESGTAELDRLAQKYARVALSQTELNGRNLTLTLNGIVHKYGTKLHGIAMTKPDEMSAIKWDSVGSTSWLSPSQYGDTIIWTGRELKRYPKKYKEQARRQHRTLFTSNGFDAEAIAADDTGEVLRLSIWSWQQQMEYLNKHQGLPIVTIEPNDVLEGNAQPTPGEVATQAPEPGHEVATRVERDIAEISTLPMLSTTIMRDTYTDENGEQQERETPLLVSRGESMRLCDSCFLSSKCPAYKPNNTCAYNIPVQIRTKEQFRALTDTMLEWQTQRVLFGLTSEQMEGGMPDPNISAEMDRLSRLMKNKSEMEQEGFNIKIEASGRGEAGVISRLFGRDAGQVAQQLPEPVSDRQAIEYIMDAEVVE